MKNKKQTVRAKFLELFLVNHSFITGGDRHLFDPSQKEFVFGFRLNQIIYDFSILLLRWRLVLKCLINIRRHRLPILFVGYPVEFETLFFMLARRYNLLFIKNGLWLNGFITNNALSLLGYKKKTQQKYVLCSTIKNLKKGFFYRDLTGKRFFTLNYFPKVLIVFNSLENWDCIKEARQAGIPVFCFASTDANMLASDFFVPLNMKSLVQKIFYYHFIKYIVQIRVKRIKRMKVSTLNKRQSKNFKSWKRK